MADDEGRIERRKQELGGEDGSNLVPIAALLGIVAVVAAVGYVFLVGGGSEPDPGIYGNVSAGEGRDPVMVSSRAPLQEDAVTVVYYGDFDCPHCLDFEEQYMSRLMREYVADGEVRLVFRPLRVVSRNSYRAGVAAHCVWNGSPDAYWRWHSTIFSQQGGGDWATYDRLVDYTRGVSGVDAGALRDCIESGRFDGAIQRHMSEANRAGVRATPTLVINGTAVGGNDYDAVLNAIESELGNTGA